MVFNNIESTRYDIDLVKPFQNSKIKFLQRTGDVIQLFIDGECGCGEAAPLYPYSEESLSQLSWSFEELKIALKNDENYTKNDLLDLFELYAKRIPSLHFALDLSLYDILAQKEKISLSKYLNPNSLSEVKLSSIYNGEVNQSFNTIKIKFGLQEIDKEVNLLYNLSNKYGDETQFRIDANQIYSIDDFLYLIDKLKNFNIQYIEEPLAELNMNNLEKIKEKCDIPLAIDESIFQKNYKEFIENKLIEYAVIKPSLYGGVKAIFALSNYLKKHNTKIILSSSLHTRIGNLANIHLASALELPDFHGLNNHTFYQFYHNKIPYGRDDTKVKIDHLNGLGVCMDD